MGAKRVLVIDDSEVVLAAAENALTEAGFEVKTLADASQVEAVARAFSPDVVLVDVRMPEASGAKITQLLRGFSDAPIVLYSDVPQAELERVAVLCGASGFLSKDAGLGELVNHVKSWAAMRRRER